MEKYRVVIENGAASFLSSLSKKIRRQIARNIDVLEENPRPKGCVKLDTESNIYRIRSGDYRIIYQVKDKVLLILVVRIRHRKEVYRDIQKLLKKYKQDL